MGTGRKGKNHLRLLCTAEFRDSLDTAVKKAGFLSRNEFFRNAISGTTELTVGASRFAGTLDEAVTVYIADEMMPKIRAWVASTGTNVSEVLRAVAESKMG